MKFSIAPLALALFTFNLSVYAQSTTDDCAIEACMPLVAIIQGCGMDVSTTSTDSSSTISATDQRCICSSSGASSIINNCIACMKKSYTLDTSYDSFAELCAGASGAGARSAMAFGGASVVVGVVMAGMAA